MCMTCAKGVRVLERVAGKRYANVFLWNFTAFPFDHGWRTARQLRREAQRITRRLAQESR